MEIKKQIILLFAIALLFSASFNSIRSNGISWKSVPNESIDNLTDALEIDKPSIKNINLGLAQSLHQKGLLFVDARSKEYLADGFIPKAIANDNFDSLAENINRLIGLNTAFIVYCSDDNCGSSDELAYELQAWGFNNILVFKGGWKSWKDSGLEIEHNE